jgi:hypothetical protein
MHHIESVSFGNVSILNIVEQRIKNLATSSVASSHSAFIAKGKFERLFPISPVID